MIEGQSFQFMLLAKCPTIDINGMFVLISLNWPVSKNLKYQIKFKVPFGMVCWYSYPNKYCAVKWQHGYEGVKLYFWVPFSQLILLCEVQDLHSISFSMLGQYPAMILSQQNWIHLALTFLLTKFYKINEPLPLPFSSQFSSHLGQ